MIDRFFRHTALVSIGVAVASCVVWAQGPPPYRPQPAPPSVQIQPPQYGVQPPAGSYPAPTYRTQTYQPPALNSYIQDSPYGQPQPYSQPGSQYQQGSYPSVAPSPDQPGLRYAFRPDLNNYQYGQCLTMERQYMEMWHQYREAYMKITMMGQRHPMYGALTQQIQAMKQQMDTLWNNFSGTCIYYPSQAQP